MNWPTAIMIPVTGLLIALIFSGCRDNGGTGERNLAPPVNSTANVSLSLSPSSVSPGQSFTATVNVQDATTTFYAAFDLTYDPTVIEYTGASEGPFLSRSGSDPTSFQAALQDGQPGRVTVGVTRLGGIGDVSGTGTLLTLSFKGVGEGNTTLVFSNPKGFKDHLGQDVAIDTWEDATFTVQ